MSAWNMNARALRRLATDRNALYSQPLPPNYLLPSDEQSGDVLNEVDVLLAGPAHTPFSAGVFRLHLSIPSTYPDQPPTAAFRTPIFHPNVDPTTGGVCVETLKRDWDSKLTLKDILFVISCLLIQPNPDSALNAEAGSLIQEDYNAFARRAVLMTDIHACVPGTLKDAVKEAQNRGQVAADEAPVVSGVDVIDFAAETAVPGKRRRLGGTARQKGLVANRRTAVSPIPGSSRMQHGIVNGRPFVRETNDSDPFGGTVGQAGPFDRRAPASDSSSVAGESDRENDESLSPTKIRSPKLPTPRRPPGQPVALGELQTEGLSESDGDMEPEYPPSPRKSPSKSPRKQLPWTASALSARPDSSRDAAAQARNITPANLTDRPLAADSPFAQAANAAPSPRKSRLRQTATPERRKAQTEVSAVVSSPEVQSDEISERESPSSLKQESAFDARLWRLCGGDLRRWNRADFDGDPFNKIAPRW
ncbi:hypothetical protein BAUCODRAFT_201820 [Baudoinia panamericana UAMH 10762]|uniref:Ubiquitin-conjugating enzyme E2 2 n=1 Tax=Baudoinia panamericana (strain UAMH 10762) TaxID=717646 RepID=M2NNU0_BAUPA|nr:uncharacterized protein BAUCODRAFT_201820 [Baudoinia panamericana UAMH 10762]EMD01200.1 hypothetical protein BAUCODRAFT_201820 [Baudoinia panamericana UAMH 10762]